MAGGTNWWLGCPGEARWGVLALIAVLLLGWLVAPSRKKYVRIR